MDDNQQSLQSYEDNVLFCLNRAEVSDRDTSAFLDNLGWTIQRAQDKIQLQGTGERKPGKWCSKNSYEVLSDQVDDDEVSTTDGEMCDLPDEEVWPRLDSQRSARAKCMTSMKRVRHRKAWKTVGFNDEIQYLGDGGQQPEINNLSGAPMGIAKQQEDVHRPTLREIDCPETNHGGLQPRSAKITFDIVTRYGVSEKCAKCRAMKRGDFSQPALGHSKECRTRIENMMREDPEMKDRLDRAEERKNRYIAERVEQAVTKQESEAAQSSSSGPEIPSAPVQSHADGEPMEVEKAKDDAFEPPPKRRRED